MPLVGREMRCLEWPLEKKIKSINEIFISENN